MPQLQNNKFSSSRTTNVIELCRWAKAYSKYGQYAQEANIRYYIGFYQISQGIAWKKTESEYESWASSAIHMMGAAEMLCTIHGIEEHLPKDIVDIVSSPISWRELMLVWSRGMQMVHYGVSCANALSRKSRFDEEKLVTDVARAVEILFGAIPVVKRRQAILDATSIMVGRL